MAGIGFQLRRLARQDTISSIVASAGHAAMIAAGPWLFTIAALAMITILAEQIAGLATLADFRAIVIYAFATSLVFAAPITIVATRLVGDALWARQPERIRPLLLGAYLMVLVPVGIAVVVEIMALAIPWRTALVLASSSLVVSLTWLAIAFCGAVRDYRGVTLSFLGGLGIALLATVGLAIAGWRSSGMAWGFTAGLTATLFGLTSRVFATFPHPVHHPLAAVAELLLGLAKYWRIALGALLGTAGVWADKWVFWRSSVGEQVESGLLHAPVYDSTMFIASLVLVPALASFVVKLETGFFECYQQYYAVVSAHGTLRQIEAARDRLARYTFESLTLITVSLVGIAAIVLLTAPIIVDALGLQFRQIAILRYGALGAVFHFVFIAASSLLLFFDRRRRYFFVQTLFLALNAGLAAVSLQLGEDFYGVGYFAACLIAAGVAVYLAEQTLARLNFLTFIGNNPSVTGASHTATGWFDALLTRAVRTGDRRLRPRGSRS